MRRRFWFLRIACGVLALAALAIPATALAQSDPSSPIGRWKTIDDSTKKPKSIIEIWEKGGVVYGTIDSIFPDPGKPSDPICDKCDGALKDKPIVGMTILWGLTKDGSEWSGGRIVDPANGKIYRCYIEVADHGARLKVRGYVGLSIIGRTQYWVRVP